MGEHNNYDAGFTQSATRDNMEVEAQSMARGGDFNVDAAPAAGEGIYDCDEWLERERPPSIQALGTIERPLMRNQRRRRQRWQTETAVYGTHRLPSTKSTLKKLRRQAVYLHYAEIEPAVLPSKLPRLAHYHLKRFTQQIALRPSAHQPGRPILPNDTTRAYSLYGSDHRSQFDS